MNRILRHGVLGVVLFMGCASPTPNSPVEIWEKTIGSDVVRLVLRESGTGYVIFLRGDEVSKCHSLQWRKAVLSLRLREFTQPDIEDGFLPTHVRSWLTPEGWLTYSSAYGGPFRRVLDPRNRQVRHCRWSNRRVSEAVRDSVSSL